MFHFSLITYKNMMPTILDFFFLSFAFRFPFHLCLDNLKIEQFCGTVAVPQTIRLPKVTIFVLIMLFRFLILSSCIPCLSPFNYVSVFSYTVAVNKVLVNLSSIYNYYRDNGIHFYFFFVCILTFSYSKFNIGAQDGIFST